MNGEQERRNDQQVQGILNTYSAKVIIDILLETGALQFLSEACFSFMVYFQLLYLQLEWDFPNSIPVCPLLFFSCLCFFQSILNRTQLTQNEEEGEWIQKAVNWGSVVMYLILIILNIHAIKWKWSLLNFALLIGLIAKIFFLQTFLQEITSAKQFFFNLFRLLLVAQSLSACLRLDNIISLNWKTVFWPYYIVFAMLIIGCLIVITIGFHTGCKLIKGNASTKEFVVSLWMFFGMIGVSCVSLSSVLNMIYYLNGEEDRYAQAIFVPMFFCPIFGVMTLFVYKTVTKKEEVGNPEGDRSAAALNQSSLRQMASVLTNPSFIQSITRPSRYPIFIHKNSPTLYTRIDKHFSEESFFSKNNPNKATEMKLVQGTIESQHIFIFL